MKVEFDDLIKLMRGDLVQYSNRTYLFDNKDRDDLIEWFDEMHIRYQTSHIRIVYVEFDDDNLAMEFKLKF